MLSWKVTARGTHERVEDDADKHDHLRPVDGLVVGREGNPQGEQRNNDSMRRDAGCIELLDSFPEPRMHILLPGVAVLEVGSAPQIA